MRILCALVLAAGPALAADPPPPKPGQPRLPAGFDPDKLGDPKEAEKAAAWLETEYPPPRSEAVRMLVAILRGSQLNGTDGWFGPAETRYTWAWLAGRCGADAKAKEIPKAKFAGPPALFDALDRDGDGTLTPSDIDWSDRSPYVMQAGVLNRVFRRLDTSGDGRLTKAEFDAAFAMIAGGKETFTADDLRRALIPRGPMGFTPGDEPTMPVLVRGLLAGDIGAMAEGPKLGEPAPDFTLKSADGASTVRLSERAGGKPLVLVFGNFTCGPFRGLYPDVDAVYRRHKDRANFLMVYVREAHPTDGWKMVQNSRMGVAAKQPTTYAERVGVCEQFRKMVNPGVTVAVDEIDDPVGTAYSGMPARLYVLDPAGKVVYKSGRGPFGFKPGEMEQALVMSLLESEPAAKPGAAGR
jgi:thiol-disulfide isomerase/thioredoxin